MLTDLFSHKIHATNLEEWEKTLVRVSEAFNLLADSPYDPIRLDDQLAKLSPNAARSAFRDQFSIYMSIFGIGQIVFRDGGWWVRTSKTARRYLLRSEPDVASFLRLQLALYQRPDGRGLVYAGEGRHEPASANEKLKLNREGYRVCPLRLILGGIFGKAMIEGANPGAVELTPDELYTLANRPSTRSEPSPSLNAIAIVLEELRKGSIAPPTIKRKTFRFLEATGLLSIDSRSNAIRLQDKGTDEANILRDRQCEAIRTLPNFFEGFSKCRTRAELVSEAKSGDWPIYFDAVDSLPPSIVSLLSDYEISAPLNSDDTAKSQTREDMRQPSAPVGSNFAPSPGRPSRPIRFSADPEETRIRRERRNAYHDLILSRLATKITERKLSALANDFIDLYTNVENTQKVFGQSFSISNSFLQHQNLPYFKDDSSASVSFLFEAKSSDDQILGAQVRRAVSQLYEYRFRYAKTELHQNTILVIALQERPSSIPWLGEYLLIDRRIGVCWLSEGLDEIVCPAECFPLLQAFVDRCDPISL